MDNTQTVISFCTGYGGIELGLKLAGAKVRTVAYVEIEAFACANLVSKIEQGKMDAAPIWTDVKSFDGRLFRRKIHGIIGGYPCQPFSNAGKRQGTEDPRHLWPYILEHIRTIRPVWCFFENVSGHLTLGFDEVFKSLRGLGYKVEAGLFTAAEVGAPHKRERLFILAYAECIGGRERLPQVKGNIQREELPAGKPYDRNTIRGDVTRCGELGNPDGQHGRPQPEGRNHNAKTRSTGQELADARCNEQKRIVGNSKKENGAIESRGTIDGRDPQLKPSCKFPARPGQEQYDFENPRTVESGMGRAVNGFASRVDELRLLGNGVVPQTAALAFRELWEKTAKKKVKKA